MNISKLKRILTQGEGLKVEFKRRVSNDIGKVITAFSNTEGGYLIIGVDDSGNIIGVDKKSEIEKLSDYISSIEPKIDVKIKSFSIDGKDIIVVEVPKSDYLHSYGGVVYIRVGSKIRPLSLKEIVEISTEHLLLSFDRSRTNIPFEEASKELIEKFIKYRRKRGLERKDTTKLFENLGIIYKKNGNYYLTFAGALAFLEDPQRYFPHTYIRIFIGNSWTRFGGSVFDQIEKAINYIYEIFPKDVSFLLPKRIDIFRFPKRAIREAIVNAIVHRNYAIESEIFVKLEPDRITIENPGSFPPGVTPNDPKPVPRNPLLYEVLFQMGFVEREGFGIRMIKEECAKSGINVIYDIRPNFTRVIFEIPEKLDAVDIKILNLIKNSPRSSTELSNLIGISKVAVLKRLKKLELIGKVKRIGRGKNTRYIIS